METLSIIKIGGNVIDDPKLLETFLKDFSAIKGKKILVHGGGKLATNLANTLGIKQTLIDGRRVTDQETLNITVMVYAGLINKKITSRLQSLQCNAFGLSGADGNLIKSKKRKKAEVDFGFVGDVPAEGINVKLFERLLNEDIVPVISPITHDGNGNLLNTNADTMATVIAVAMKSSFNVELIYCFEKKGVLMNSYDEGSFIPALNKQDYLTLKKEGVFSGGMIPKLENAFNAIEAGVEYVLICHATDIVNIETKTTGTLVLA